MVEIKLWHDINSMDSIKDSQYYDLKANKLIANFVQTIKRKMPFYNLENFYKKYKTLRIFNNKNIKKNYAVYNEEENIIFLYGDKLEVLYRELFRSSSFGFIFKYNGRVVGKALNKGYIEYKSNNLFGNLAGYLEKSDINLKFVKVLELVLGHNYLDKLFSKNDYNSLIEFFNKYNEDLVAIMIKMDYVSIMINNFFYKFQKYKLEDLLKEIFSSMLKIFVEELIVKLENNIISLNDFYGEIDNFVFIMEKKFINYDDCEFIYFNNKDLILIINNVLVNYGLNYTARIRNCLNK